MYQQTIRSKNKLTSPIDKGRLKTGFGFSDGLYLSNAITPLCGGNAVVRVLCAVRY
jgi:hypothetical protein